jgi:hypothetical protein
VKRQRVAMKLCVKILKSIEKREKCSNVREREPVTLFLEKEKHLFFYALASDAAAAAAPHLSAKLVESSSFFFRLSQKCSRFLTC